MDLDESLDEGGSDVIEGVDLSITNFRTAVALADFVLEVDEQLQREEREPTSQLGDFVFSSHERLTARGGTYRGGLDQYSKKLGTRSMGSGDDVDYAYEAGLITARYLYVPGFRLVKRALKPFRINWEDEDGEKKNADGTPQYQKPRQLPWSEVKNKLEKARDAVAGSTEEKDVVFHGRIVSLLDNDDRMILLKSLYGSSIQMVFYIQKWAQPKGQFDLTLASFGKTYWVLDRQGSDAYTHRYRGAFAPTKAWLNAGFDNYFSRHPLGDDLRRLLSLVSYPDAERHRLGYGELRYYGYNEIHARPGASVDAVREANGKMALAQQSWRLRYHLWEAFKECFLSWSLDFKHCVEANQALEKTHDIQLSVGEEFDPVVNNDPFEAIDGRTYFDYFVQPPVSFEYMLWQMVENLVQFKRKQASPRLDLNDSFPEGKDGFWEEDRIKALEVTANVFSWLERLPRCASDAKIHWHWYADPSHKDEGGNHCNGCQHWQYWATPQEYAKNPDKYRGWKREEAQIWYATRQEQQLFRKAIFTHNSGSGNMDATVDALLTVQAIVDFRHKYGGGGRERIPPKCWWTPPGVSSEFWLGVIQSYSEEESNRPYNGWMLQSNHSRLEVQNSRLKFDEQLGLNTTSLGVHEEDVKKKLVDIKNFKDGIVFPTGDGRADVSEEVLNRLYPDRPDGSKDPRRLNPWGHAWVDFNPRFNPLLPKIVLHRDPYFHLDPLWYNSRSYFDPIQINIWIESFEDAFGDDYHYVFSWPDGEYDEVDSFRDPKFRRYLISHYLQHKKLLLEFHENQDAKEFSARLRAILAREVQNGNFDGLRKIINDQMEGLPIRFWDLSSRSADGKPQKRPNQFAALKAWAYEFADNQWFKNIVLKSRDRGVQWGDVSSYVLHGGGQGYGTLEDQLLRIFKYYEVPLKNIYFDTWKGIMEAHHLLTHAGANVGKEAWEDALNDMASAVKARRLNWSFVREVAKTLHTFSEHVDLALWIDEHTPEESEELEQTWLSHLATIANESNPHGSALYVIEMSNLLALPVEPRLLQEMSDARRLTAA